MYKSGLTQYQEGGYSHRFTKQIQFEEYQPKLLDITDFQPKKQNKSLVLSRHKRSRQSQASTNV